MAISGRLLLKALAMPETRLPPPGPISPKATATWPLPAKMPAAMWAADASWRTPTKRMSDCSDRARIKGPSLPLAMPKAKRTFSWTRQETMALLAASWGKTDPPNAFDDAIRLEDLNSRTNLASAVLGCGCQHALNQKRHDLPKQFLAVRRIASAA